MSEDGDQREIVSIPLLCLAFATWFVTTFFHKEGLKVASKVFAWAKEPGTLSEKGGADGMRVFELAMAAGFSSIALVIVGAVAWRLRRAPRAFILREAIPWGAWAALLFVVWKCFIVYATELIHFGQYAAVGGLMALALGRGRYPLPAFLITCALGGVDELYQHYWLSAKELHHWMDHWMDFTDPILDALGAAGAILPFTTIARLRELEGQGPPPDTSGALVPFLVVLGLLLLPLLLLDPVTVSERLGNYRVIPYWGEYDNYKPTHWPGPREGVPVLLGSLLILGTLVEPRRKALPFGALLALLVLAALAIAPASRKQGTPVHRRVPYASAAPVLSAALTIDGKLDEEAWQQTERLGPFVRSQDAGACRQRTWARVLYSDHAIYFAFEVEDEDVWARDVPDDTKTLPGDEVVEVFLDDGGDEVTYYEFEVSPKNALYDLFCFIPAGPVDYSHWAPFTSMKNWTGPGIRRAVHVDGELDLLPADADGRYAGQRKLGGDRGWTVELAIPWDDFRTEPWIDSPLHPMPPRPGDRWRLGLFRFDRYRATDAELAGGDMTAAEAEQVLGARWFAYVRMTDVLKPKEGGLFARKQVFECKDELQAWAPTWHPQGMTHRPYWFGELEFRGPR